MKRHSRSTFLKFGGGQSSQHGVHVTALACTYFSHLFRFKFNITAFHNRDMSSTSSTIIMAHHKLAESYLERLIDAERIIFNLKRTAEDMQACNDALTAENTALTAQLSTIKFDKALTELADRIKAMVGLHAHDMESPAAGAELAEIDQRAALVRKIQERSEQDQVVASAAQEYGRQEWEEDEADEAFETSAIHVSEGAQEETGYG